MCSLSPLLLSEKLGIGGSLLIVQCNARGEAYGKCLSVFPTHFDVGMFSVIQCVGIVQLVSGFFSKRIAPYVAVYLVYAWEGGNSGASYITIMVKNKIKTLPSAFKDYFNPYS